MSSPGQGRAKKAGEKKDERAGPRTSLESQEVFCPTRVAPTARCRSLPSPPFHISAFEIRQKTRISRTVESKQFACFSPQTP